MGGKASVLFTFTMGCHFEMFSVRFDRCLLDPTVCRLWAH